MEINAEGITKKRILTYLSIVFGILHIPWIIGMIIPSLGDTIYTIISFWLYLWEHLHWLFLSRER